MTCTHCTPVRCRLLALHANTHTNGAVFSLSVANLVTVYRPTDWSPVDCTLFWLIEIFCHSFYCFAGISVACVYLLQCKRSCIGVGHLFLCPHYGNEFVCAAIESDSDAEIKSCATRDGEKLRCVSFGLIAVLAELEIQRTASHVSFSTASDWLNSLIYVARLET